MSKQKLVIPITSPMYGFNPEKMILDKIVYEVDSSDITW
jgi:hypothetical protein